jgi:hypothetical protein
MENGKGLYDFDIILSKKEAIKMLNKTCNLRLNVSNTIYSNINDAVPQWWFEPTNEKFEEDLNLILNNQIDKILYYFFIPNGAIPDPRNLFYQRGGRDNRTHIVVNVDNNNFVDNNSNFHFRPYLRKTLNYQGRVKIEITII